MYSHLSPSLRSTVGATRDATRALQPSRCLQFSTISWSPVLRLASMRLPTRFFAGRPRLRLPSTLPISTEDIRDVFECLTAWPAYLRRLLSISYERSLDVFNSQHHIWFLVGSTISGLPLPSDCSIAVLA